ncbi:hypothetical protein VARIO8X_110038 [Burkholderiales bacterium 8X]|nr:hypothetical protein VARIO8X_110038 [Burkholderiales bacterium 8X]
MRRDHRLGPVADVERPEDGCEMDLDRAFADAERTADQLVGLALRQQLQHLDLPLGQHVAQVFERLRRDVGAAPARATVAAEVGDTWHSGQDAGRHRGNHHGRHVDAARQHQPHRGQHHLGRIGLGDEAQHAALEHAAHDGRVLVARQHDHRHGRVAAAHFLDMGLAVGAGHVEVDHCEVELVRGLGEEFVHAHHEDELDVGFQLRQLGLDCLDDEPMVVSDQDFHVIPQDIVVNYADSEHTVLRLARQGVLLFERYSSHAVWRRIRQAARIGPCPVGAHPVHRATPPPLFPMEPSAGMTWRASTTAFDIC